MAEKSDHSEVIIASTICDVFGCLSPSDPDTHIYHLPLSMQQQHILQMPHL